MNELQLCLTNKCNIGCKYCHIDKSKIKNISLKVVKKTVKEAKKNNIEYIRLTGGSIFEHENLNEIINYIKESKIKIILNISSKELHKLYHFYDILLISYLGVEDLKKLEQKEVMGCIVFQKKWLNHIKEVVNFVEDNNFVSFFFLRDTNENSKEYFNDYCEFIERICRLTDKITFANAFPLCYISFNNIKYCSGSKFDNGNKRMYITQEGNIKASSYSKVLGNVFEDDLKEIWQDNKKKINEDFEKIELCKNCKIKDICKGGIHNDLIKENVFENNFKTKLQKKIIKVLPETNYNADLRQLYYENSDFFMRYIPFNIMKKGITPEINNEKLSLYVHFPFCKGFCKFCKIEKLEKSEEYIQDLLKDIENNKELIQNNKIEAIYFGGGTPQLMGLNNAKKIFEKLFSYVKEVKEVSFETFPGYYDNELFKYIKKYVNRISIGVQCFNDEILKKMNRNSSKREIIDFIKKIKQLGFETINFDVIYGLFINNKEEFEKDFREILEYNPDQITLQPLHFIKEIKYEGNIENEIELNKTARKILKEKGFNQTTGEDFSKGKKFLYQKNLLNDNNILGLGNKTFSIINNTHLWKENGIKSYKSTRFDQLYSRLFLKSRTLNLNIEELNSYEINYKTMFSDSLKYLLKLDWIIIKDNIITITKEGKEYVDLISNILSLSNLDYKKSIDKINKVKIVAPASNLKDVEEYEKLKVDELYIGLIDSDDNKWHQINKRNENNANFTNIEDIKKIKEINKYSEVSLTLNASFYNKKGIKKVKKQIEETKNYVDNYIIADPSIIPLVKKTGKGIILSCISATMNSQAVKFFKGLGVKKIILPRHLNIKEIKKIISENKDMEFEVMILNQFCRNVDGLCSRCHIPNGEYALSNCYIPYKSKVIKLKECNDETVKKVHQNIANILTKFNPECGICFIEEFEKYGIDSLKIVGRDHLTEKKIKDVKLIKEILKGLTKEECKDKFEENFGFKCNNNCYY